MQPTVTICSDASHSIKYEVSAWACYIRTPTRTVKTGGILKQKVKGSTDAESLGLANALYLTNKLVNLSKFKLIIYCDNIGAMTKPKVSKTSASQYYALQVAKLQWFEQHIQVILDKAASYETRHVKAHTAKSTWSRTSKRNYMNDWCDMYAKEIMQKEKKRIKTLIKEE